MAENSLNYYIRQLKDKSEMEAALVAMDAINNALGSGSWSMRFDENSEMISCMWGDRFRKMIGYDSSEDFPNKLTSWSDLIHPEDKRDVLLHFWDVVRDRSGSKIYNISYRLLTKDRGYRWFRAAGSLTRREDGSPDVFYGLFIDIDQRNRAAIKEKEYLGIIHALSSDYFNIITIMPESDQANMIKARGSDTEYMSTQPERFIYSKVLKGYVDKEVHPDDRSDFFTTLSPRSLVKIFETQDIYEYTYRVLRDNETHYYYSRFAKASQKDEPLKIIAGSRNIDAIITKEMKVQEEIRQFERIFASAPPKVYLGALIIDLETWIASRYLNTNGRFEKIENIRYKEELERLLGFVFLEDRDSAREFFSYDSIEKMANDEVKTIRYRGISEYMPGKHHYYETSLQKRELEGKSVVVEFFHDVTESVEEYNMQQQAVLDALAAAEHANRAKTVFLNSMSHDIRTPMNAIIGFTTLAAKHIEDKERVTEYLGKIQVSSSHLLSLINDVLDMSRIESGKVKLEETEVHLPDVLHDLRTIVQPDIKVKNIDFFIDILDVVDENIICDRVRLNQILLNIISNAIKFTKVGGQVAVKVVQNARAPKGYAGYTFRIKDTGIGMSREFLEHIFEPFERERTATVSGIQGTGLGMSITKNIVDMMGGTIDVKSEEGKGSEFIVNLQFKKSGTKVIYGPIPELEGAAALVVDDDIDCCISVCKMMEEIGLRSEWSTSGHEAIVRTQFACDKNDPFAVFIIDWLMPDMNGIETVRRIRRIIGEETPIIILTAYDWGEIAEEAKEAGVTHFIAKPIFMSELREVLAKPFRVVVRKDEAEEARDFCGKKILLVEDNELNQEIAREILEEYGFVVDVADDGTVAVEMMKKAEVGQYDLILMDVQMPQMDGYEAARHIRAIQDPLLANIPIIAVTANAFEEDKKLALASGMDGHIAKPINIANLISVLEEVLH